jgi:dCMP deaminase
MELGCHHAEQNVVCNAAANGTSTRGCWLVVTGEPCLMCAKLIHHAGIVKVLVVQNGYMGANGVEYLRKHGVEVEAVEGPQDPRIAQQGA